MRFRLFSMDVEIQGGFWLSAFLLAMMSMGGLEGVPKAAFVIFALVVLVSILVHELGHAVAIRRHGIEPAITLHFMGGTTTWRAVTPLRRLDMVVISLAGPFAGFAIVGLIYGVEHFAPTALAHLPILGQFAVQHLLWINTWWGVFNLIPVLPLDGGHVLEHALGPKRARATAIISFAVGMIAVLVFLKFGLIWAAFIVGMGAFRSFQRFQGGAGPAIPAPPRARPAPPAEEPLSPEHAIPLRRAREALGDEQLGRAISLANQVLAGETDSDEPPSPPPPLAAHGALEILAWAHLLGGHLEQATLALDNARKLAPPDGALVAALLMAKGMKKEARRVLEAARAAGDERKEIVGPLVQLLIEAGEVPRAAAVALDIVDSLSEEDARQMATITFDHGAFEWAARLSEKMFERTRAPEDAYEAARALAKDQQHERAIELLRQAVDAGFTDRARAWSDAALEALRAEPALEAVLPRP